MTTLDMLAPLYGPVDERAGKLPAGGVLPAIPIPSGPLPVPSRSHHHGEGQTQRTITQDEQDRLASSRDRPSMRHRQAYPA